MGDFFRFGCFAMIFALCFSIAHGLDVFVNNASVTFLNSPRWILTSDTMSPSINSQLVDVRNKNLCDRDSLKDFNVRDTIVILTPGNCPRGYQYKACVEAGCAGLISVVDVQGFDTSTGNFAFASWVNSDKRIDYSVPFVFVSLDNFASLENLMNRPNVSVVLRPGDSVDDYREIFRGNANAVFAYAIALANIIGAFLALYILLGLILVRKVTFVNCTIVTLEFIAFAERAIYLCLNYFWAGFIDASWTRLLISISVIISSFTTFILMFWWWEGLRRSRFLSISPQNVFRMKVVVAAVAITTILTELISYIAYFLHINFIINLNPGPLTACLVMLFTAVIFTWTAWKVRNTLHHVKTLKSSSPRKDEFKRLRRVSLLLGMSAVLMYVFIVVTLMAGIPGYYNYGELFCTTLIVAFISITGISFLQVLVFRPLSPIILLYLVVVYYGGWKSSWFESLFEANADFIRENVALISELNLDSLTLNRTETKQTASNNGTQYGSTEYPTAEFPTQVDFFDNLAATNQV